MLQSELLKKNSYKTSIDDIKLSFQKLQINDK